MKIYSDYSGQAARQVTFDVLAVLSIALWLFLGTQVYRLVSQLTDYGEMMESAGSGLRSTMAELGDTLGGVPFIGGGIREPFDAAASAGAQLESAGVSQQESVHQLALGLGIGLAAIPALTILLFWLVPRLRFVMRAATVKKMAAEVVGIDLLALRALTRQKLGVLARVDPDVAGKWRAGDPQIMRELAMLELRAAGVRLPEESSQGPGRASVTHE
jgi:hypothetical protein